MTARVDIAIVGAGAAGVGAARRLAKTGCSILVLEASTQVGGRAHTVRLDRLPLDLGCGWLHSAERNAWALVADENGFALDRGESAWGTQFRDLGFSPADQEAAHATYARWTERLSRGHFASDRASDALEPGDPWNGWVEALSGYLNGAAVAQLSVADYLAYDDSATDRNWRVREGYGTLVAASLPASVPLALGTPVTAIDHRGTGVRIQTARGTIHARTAIVTLSTAALPAVRFADGLDDHLHAAACLPLGLADKLFLSIEGAAPFEDETHLIGNPRRGDTGSYYIRPMGMPVIEGFFGGPGAEAVERDGPAAAFARALDELAALLGADIRRHLRPLTGSAWRRSQWIGGSYSHALPGHADKRAVLAHAVDDRLFFAGEATHPTDFSTAHGAYESGLRAAEEALAALG